MDYNIFQKKTVGKNGKIVKRWYYWYVENGRQKQKVCKNCKTKAEAFKYITSLPSRDSSFHTIKDIANSMYIPGSEHVNRREQFGRSVVLETLNEARRYICLIIKNFGNDYIEDVDVAKIGNFLLEQNYSGSWKSRFCSIFGEIFDEAIWYGVKVQKPNFPRFTRKPGKADIFTSEELRKLFVVSNFDYQKVDAKTLYLFFLISLLAGLRMGEARALRPQQFLIDKKALVIDGFCKQEGARTNFNKKGSITNTKARIVILPGNVIKEIADYICDNNLTKDDYLFTYHSKPIRAEYAEDVFTRAIKAAGIDSVGRKLTPHSLRFTYITKMRRTLPGDMVRKLAGHSTIGMTDYYTRMSIEDGLAGIADSEKAVEHLFD